MLIILSRIEPDCLADSGNQKHTYIQDDYALDMKVHMLSHTESHAGSTRMYQGASTACSLLWDEQASQQHSPAAEEEVTGTMLNGPSAAGAAFCSRLTATSIAKGCSTWILPGIVTTRSSTSCMSHGL